MRGALRVASCLALFAVALPLAAQRRGAPPAVVRDPLADPVSADSAPSYVRRTAPSDPVIQRIWAEGMERSQAMTLAQELLDPIGQRLTASPQMDRAQDWLVRTYAAWGVTAQKERYGTWKGWSRGVTHVDLVNPRVRTLEAHALAWSPSTGTRPVEGEVVTFPMAVRSPEEFATWLPSARGRIVLLGAPQLSCRSQQQWYEFGTPAERTRVDSLQREQSLTWGLASAAMNAGGSVWGKLKNAGAIAVFTHSGSGHPGIQRIFGSQSQRLPAFAIGCEDYGLLFRMAENKQAPRVRAFTDSEMLGERPVFNVVATIRGREKPDEYVVLSAHFDTWSGSSGATDNGSGTVTMMEAIRILRLVYPQPKRTILVGHWSGEEQGLDGSRAFTEDHPEIIGGLHALFNQDDGTGRIVGIDAGPFALAATRLERYLGEVPSELTQWIRRVRTGSQQIGGTDNASFECHRTSAFNLGALGWDYGGTTWHTDRDTFDKVVESDLKNNAVLTAMLAYLASEDPERMPRDVLDPLPASRFRGQQGPAAGWRGCARADRQSPPPQP